MKIAENCIVSIRYQLRNDRDEVLDQSLPDEPLVYLHGAAGVLPALEDALKGKKVGEPFDVTVTSSEGFGEHLPSLIKVLPRDAISADIDLEVGMALNMQGSEGEQIVTVTAIDDSLVTVDANHPLAGLTLRFIGEVEDIREATDEEVRHWPQPPPSAS